MKLTFKITQSLLADIRTDLVRPHAFAHERVGFISAGLSSMGRDLVIVARGYRPVRDEDYLNDRTVGAMMGREAIRKSLEWAMQAGHAIFHVHTHGGRGIPGFSSVDIRENQKFVPDFFKVAPQCAHGALVLSDNAARGQIWIERTRSPLPIDSFVTIGPTLMKWSAA
jgi:hypothetical protein